MLLADNWLMQPSLMKLLPIMDDGRCEVSTLSRGVYRLELPWCWLVKGSDRLVGQG